ncbi:MAG TPA: hypothetical protein VE684_12945, partial [Crenalkalicoccus sp.]|nr:hypothetical protein [Crenalkalicoccus sp.]
MGVVADHLDEMPIWSAACLLVGGLVAFALIGPPLVRRLVGLDRLAVNNEVAGYKFAGLGAVYAAAIGWQPANGREEVILGAILGQLDALTEARRERLGLAAGVVPELVWSALVIGAVLTIAFTFFFAAESLAAQMLMSGMLALTLALSLLVVIA